MGIGRLAKKIRNVITVTSVCTFVLSSNIFASQIGQPTKTVNVRTNPSSGKVSSVIYAGDTVNIEGSQPGWYFVSKNGKKLGWVSADYLTVKWKADNTASTTKTTTQASTTSKTSKDNVAVLDAINVRTTPNSGKIATALYKGDKVTVKEQKDNWYHVSKDGKVIGWVSGTYLNIKNKPAVKKVVQPKAVAKKATVAKPVAVKPVQKTQPKQVAINTQTYATPKAAVTTATVNVRKQADIKAGSISVAYPGTSLSVVGKADNWYKVKLANNTIGFVSSNYVSFSTSKVGVNRGGYDAPKPETAAVASASKAASMVAYAKQFLGTPYVYGANGPSSFDCSGFTKYVYSHFGISLARVAADQACQGSGVASGDLQPGDLLFFHTTSPGISHVGMYIGNGQFIHASSGGGRVMISDITSGYYASAFIKAKRII